MGRFIDFDADKSFHRLRLSCCMCTRFPKAADELDWEQPTIVGRVAKKEVGMAVFRVKSRSFLKTKSYLPLPLVVCYKRPHFSNSNEEVRKMLLKKSGLRQIIGMVALTLLALGFLITTHPYVMAASEEEDIIENAKKEGKVVWYSGSDISILEAERRGFEKKYPFIKVELIRMGSAQLLAKLLTETRAKVHNADVLQLQTIDMAVLKKEDLVAKYMSPESKYFPESLKDPEGYWTSNHLNAKGISQSTNVVSSKDVPKHWEDLLDPKWKGKIMMDPTEVEWYSAMLQAWGREKGLAFMKKLCEQKIVFREGQASIMLLVAAGEYPLSVAANLDQIEPYRLKGAPIKWVGLDPVIIRLRPLALAKNSSHPNAAKLFITFLLAPEGQKVTSDIGALPARPGFESDSLKGIKTHVSTMTAAQYQDNMKELREVFFKR